jgi:hypothetical protein
MEANDRIGARGKNRRSRGDSWCCTPSRHGRVSLRAQALGTSTCSNRPTKTESPAARTQLATGPFEQVATERRVRGWLGVLSLTDERSVLGFLASGPVPTGRSRSGQAPGSGLAS